MLKNMYTTFKDLNKIKGGKNASFFFITSNVFLVLGLLILLRGFWVGNDDIMQSGSIILLLSIIASLKTEIALLRMLLDSVQSLARGTSDNVVDISRIASNEIGRLNFMYVNMDARIAALEESEQNDVSRTSH